MAIIIYSATGCLRCNIVKQYLKGTDQKYQDFDALDEGQKQFKAFYKNNREKIFRGPDGVEFPIVSDGEIIRQGLPMVLAHLFAGPALNGFFKPGLLHGQWVDGIYISGGNPDCGERFLDVLILLKEQRLKLQVETNGINAHLLEQVLKQGLADRIIMEVKGPLDLYDSLLHKTIDSEEIIKSIALVSQHSDYYFYTSISPIVREKDGLEDFSYITPEEVAEAAFFIKETIGDNLQPYKLKIFDHKTTGNEKIRSFKTLEQDVLFKYRTMARKHLFKTEILKS